MKVDVYNFGNHKGSTPGQIYSSTSKVYELDTADVAAVRAIHTQKMSSRVFPNGRNEANWMRVDSVDDGTYWIEVEPGNRNKLLNELDGHNAKGKDSSETWITARQYWSSNTSQLADTFDMRQHTTGTRSAAEIKINPDHVRSVDNVRSHTISWGNKSETFKTARVTLSTGDQYTIVGENYIMRGRQGAIEDCQKAAERNKPSAHVGDDALAAAAGAAVSKA